MSAILRKQMAIRALQDAAIARGVAVALEHEALHAKPIAKSAAIGRIMRGPDNPHTSKPHSASSAEPFAEQDEEYTAACRLVTRCVIARMQAEANYEIAKIEAVYAATVAAQAQEVIAA